MRISVLVTFFWRYTYTTCSCMLGIISDISNARIPFFLLNKKFVLQWCKRKLAKVPFFFFLLNRVVRSGYIFFKLMYFMFLFLELASFFCGLRVDCSQINVGPNILLYLIFTIYIYYIYNLINLFPICFLFQKSTNNSLMRMLKVEHCSFALEQEFVFIS